ncbi:MAG: Dabb family protein [Proteobacteria bacterium]|nr:Dabb family protein [Pseudomonadota bacterium]
MIRHVVLLRFSPEADDQDVARLCRALSSLPASVPEIRRYRFGSDLGLADGNADFAIVADFDDADAWRRYADHPAHKAVITESIAPILADRSAAQIEIPDSPEP